MRCRGYDGEALCQFRRHRSRIAGECIRGLEEKSVGIKRLTLRWVYAARAMIALKKFWRWYVVMGGWKSDNMTRHFSGARGVAATVMQWGSGDMGVARADMLLHVILVRREIAQEVLGLGCKGAKKYKGGRMGRNLGALGPYQWCRQFIRQV